MSGMGRREFVALLGGAAAAWPLAARAQRPSRPSRLGVLGPMLNNPTAIAQYQAIRAQLEELGFREGGNVTIRLLARSAILRASKRADGQCLLLLYKKPCSASGPGRSG